MGAMIIITRLQTFILYSQNVYKTQTRNKAIANENAVAIKRYA